MAKNLTSSHIDYLMVNDLRNLIAQHFWRRCRGDDKGLGIGNLVFILLFFSLSISAYDFWLC